MWEKANGVSRRRIRRTPRTKEVDSKRGRIPSTSRGNYDLFIVSSKQTNELTKPQPGVDATRTLEQVAGLTSLKRDADIPGRPLGPSYRWWALTEAASKLDTVQYASKYHPESRNIIVFTIFFICHDPFLF